MNYWHMQLHPGRDSGWKAEDVKAVLKMEIIGCSGKPVREFEKVTIGDILLIRVGKRVIALVQCLSLPATTPENKKSAHWWFDRYVKVRILKTYPNEFLGSKGWYLPTTLQRIKNPTALAYIKKLHEQTETSA